MTFPGPTVSFASHAEVLLGYIDYFRTRVIEKTAELSEHDLRRSTLPSGWTPLQLIKHLTYVEIRWIDWGFEGRHDIPDPWADIRDERWYTTPEETREVLVKAWESQGAHTRSVVTAAELTDLGRPGPRWDGAEPPSLERILLHIVQEYARHLGHLDIVTELATGSTGR